MTTSVTANLKEAASARPDFAAALSASLARAIPATEARNEPAASGGLTPPMQEAAKRSSNPAGATPEPVAGAPLAGTETSAPAKKSGKRAEDLSSGNRLAAFASATSQTNVATIPAPIKYVDNSAILKFGGPRGNMAAPEISANTVDTIPETSKIDPRLETVAAPAEDSAAARSIPAGTADVKTAPSEQPVFPSTVETQVLAAQPQSRSTNLKGWSEFVSANPPDIQPHMIQGLQAVTLPVQPRPQNAYPSPSHESGAPITDRPTLDGTAVAPSPDTSNRMADTRSPHQTTEISKDDSNGTVAHQSSGSMIDAARAAAPIRELSSSGEKSVERQQIQTLDTESSLPITAIHVESWVSANLQDIPRFNLAAPSGSETSAFVPPIGNAESGDLSPQIETEGAGTENISRKDDGKIAASDPSDSATNRNARIFASPLPETGSAEGPRLQQMARDNKTPSTRADRPAMPEREIVFRGGNPPVHPAAPIAKDGKQIAEAISPNGQRFAQPEPSGIEDPGGKDGGAKNPAGAARNFATERVAGDPAGSLPEVRSAERPKSDPPASAPASEGMQSKFASMPIGKTVSGDESSRVSGGPPISKDGDQNGGAHSSKGADQAPPISLGVEEDFTKKDGEKNQPSPASDSAANRGAPNPAGSAPERTNADASEIGLTTSVKPLQGAPTDASAAPAKATIPGDANSTAHFAEPMPKGSTPSGVANLSNRESQALPVARAAEENPGPDSAKTPASRASDSATDRNAGIPPTSLSQAGNEERPKLEPAAPVNAARTAQTNASALPAAAPVSVDATAPVNPVNPSAPISGGGNQTTDANSSNSDEQPQPAFLNAEADSQKVSGKTTASRASILATDRRTAIPTTSLPEAAGAEQPKFQQAPSANAPQGPQADVTSMPAAKTVSGGGSPSANVVAPISKDGNPSNAPNPSNADDPQHPALAESVHLSSEISKSDVKIALQGEQFGSVEVHAKVAGDQVSASITVEHREIHAALSGDMPALQQLLADRHLRVNEILLLHDALSGRSSHDGAPANREESSPRQAGGPSENGGDETPPVASISGTRTGPNEIFDSRGRLSVRA